MSEEKVRSAPGVPPASAFQGTSGTPIIINSTTGIPYVRTDAGVVVAISILTIAEIIALATPAGALLDFAGTVAPTGWVACDGASLLRASFPALFTAIGTTWGSVDGTHFNVPNFNRRTAVGSGGSGTGTLGNAVGNTGGVETHTLVIGEVPAHDHGTTTSSDGSHTHGPGAGTFFENYNTSGGESAGELASEGALLSTPSTTTAAGGTHSHTVSSQGGGTSHNNMQPSAVVLKCIKT